MSENKDKIQAMHEKCSKLKSEDLILILVHLNMQGSVDPKIMTIMKTYLFRALFNEGFR